jgi:fatty acid desaturase
MSTTAPISAFTSARNVGHRTRPISVFRDSSRDAWLVGLALLHAALLTFGLTCVQLLADWAALVCAVLFAVGVCWSSNTVSHNHLHRPLFRANALNLALSWLLTLTLGVPQTLWRGRHFWHHAGEPAQPRPRVMSRQVLVEAGAILALWAGLLALSPRAFLTAYLPGHALGLLLCRLQGDMEHRRTRSPTRGVSYYGKLYNWLWFNDGYHAEHHRFPSEHWTRLPTRSGACDVAESAWPPLLRWLERPRPAPGAVQAGVLGLLERLALRSPLTQRYLLWSHERAFRHLLSRRTQVIRRVVIVGGGLFPRTALVLRSVLPDAELTIIDQSEESLRVAREFLVRRRLDTSDLHFEHAAFRPQRVDAHDLVVVPLAFVGDRRLLQQVSAARPVLIHEWLWQRSSPRSAVISWLLLKRLSLLEPARNGDS